MSLTKLSEQYRTEQTRLNREATRQLALIFPALNLKDLDRTAPGWVYAVEQATAKHYAKTQALAADVYTATRLEAGVSSRVSFVLPDMNGGKLRASLTYEGPYLGKRLIGEGRRIPDVGRLLFGKTSSIALRHGMSGGRDTIAATGKADTATTGQGWMRVTAADPCGFCAMKALTIYRSEDTAGDDYHDGDCRCVPMPRFGDAVPDGYADQMKTFEVVYQQNMAATKNRRGIEIIDTRQTIRNMNRAMRQIAAGTYADL